MKEDWLTIGDTREIRIRRGLPPARRLFTIAHELGTSSADTISASPAPAAAASPLRSGARPMPGPR
jgi:hypothetical protein